MHKVPLTQYEVACGRQLDLRTVLLRALLS
jgi:hypothetical protein